VQKLEWPWWIRIINPFFENTHLSSPSIWSKTAWLENEFLIFSQTVYKFADGTGRVYPAPVSLAGAFPPRAKT
jgi:hypothetical protein